MPEPKDEALRYFLEGYNCSQATAMAFAPAMERDPSELARLMAGFGAGMGGLRGTCGAVCAIAFVAGWARGAYPPLDNAAKKAFYDEIKAAVALFEERFGTSTCKELLAKAGALPAPDPSDRDAAYYASRPCARFVSAAAQIIQSRFIEKA
jgi:C_GCAxxG_C_C family probable redox protein